MTCTCNNETLTKQILCHRCYQYETIPLKYTERVARCLEHQYMEVILFSLRPPIDYLCIKCQDDGFYVDNDLIYILQSTIKNVHNVNYNKKLWAFDPSDLTDDLR